MSPTAGSLEQRVNGARIRVSDIGECIAINVTPADAHRSLLDSPAHRAGMLGASFTHVGIGVVFLDRTQGNSRLIGVGTARVQSDVGPRVAVIIITDAGAGACQ